MLGYCCGCISHGLLHEEVHGQGCFPAGALWYLTSACCLPQCVFGPNLRKTTRIKYQLPEEPCGGAFCMQTAAIVLLQVPQSVCC